VRPITPFDGHRTDIVADAPSPVVLSPSARTRATHSPAQAQSQISSQPNLESEMDAYLKEDKLDMRVDLLSWWKTVGSLKYPRVAKMARQYLGIPATSAGVERLFSKCGRAYACLSQSTKDSTLEARMFAGINVGRWAADSDSGDNDYESE
jgi:hypothetical protein